ncbi:hypothetical protein G3T14_20785 [Methylobacterium sp. BTF04]|uniref:DNA-binding protein n=1 Tax=Methylobacterium sp. BTF04 TaxID=2708300 RepID=UPI0013CF4B15|nr:DNA-binding protein [Methylobacterium sp. BTF04]NEU14535.1 hypothetical protein [Methylobacterium sp. BTF04]
MPSEAAVFIVADAMIARGERPSLRAVLKRLAMSGSIREVGKHLRAWREQRGYGPGLAPTDVPGEVEDAEAENSRKVARQTKVESQPDRSSTEKFWDHVMREIFEILPATGTMTADKILQELRAETLHGAVQYKEPLTPAILRRKMEVRITHGKCFLRLEDGGYARKLG